MIWNANFVPLVGSIALWGLIDFLELRRSRSLGLALLAIGCTAELHVVAGVYIIIWLAVAVLCWRYVHWRHQLVALGALLATIAPYIVFEVQNGWADVWTLQHFLGRPAVTDVEALDTTGELVGAMTFWRMLPGGFPGAWFHYDALSWALIALTLLGAGWALATRKPGGLVLTGWLALPVLLTIHHSQRVWPWYLLGGVPAMVLLEGVGVYQLSKFMATLTPRARLRLHPKQVAAGGAVLCSLALTVAAGAAYLSFQKQIAATSHDDEYGVPLRYSMAAAHEVESLIGSQPMYLAAPENHSPVIPFLAGVPTWQRRYSGRTVVLLPPQPTWYVAAADGLENGLLRRFAGKPAASVNTTDGSTEFALFHMPGEREVLGRPDFKPFQADIGGGIRLEGYIPHTLAAGQPSEVDLLWRVTNPEAAAATRFSQFAHLVDASGHVWSSAPDLWNIVEPWQEGDLLVWPVDLNVSPDAPLGGYWLETGFYETFSGRPAAVTEPGYGNATSVRIGPLRVTGKEQPIEEAPPVAR
ncbi:MAG TPA: hypothetical protein VKU60_12620, partial [Chloroflexota bacterium]|nr:hypothetical protein [Chloroflexota bacterium]